MDFQRDPKHEISLKYISGHGEVHMSQICMTGHASHYFTAFAQELLLPHTTEPPNLSFKSQHHTTTTTKIQCVYCIFFSQYFMAGDTMLFLKLLSLLHVSVGVQVCQRTDIFGKLFLSFHFYINSED